ncbi:MAG TPA: competence/damage-inducible protein A [Vicinamibacterales bacterium]|nr:competence/damage-inducible protein A [Vicinamibacterales bacterium]
MKPLTRAAILAVGSELLTPSRIDTNSLFITEQLNRIGIEVVLKLVVGDSREELARAFQLARSRAELVVSCGGLGPTDDDVTREAVAGVLGRPLAEDEAITAQLRARFAARGFTTPMPEINRRQAMVPKGARVLENTRGSAPGLWIEDEDGLTLLLPGPPRELRPMLSSLVDGQLGTRSSGTSISRRVIRVAGRIESHVDEVLSPLYREWEALQVPIGATILAALGQIELHLSVRSASRDEADAALERAAAQVVEFLGADVFTTRGLAMEQVVGDLLVDRNLRIALAESCTGGLITSRLTDVPGSSRYVQQSVVVYSNESKTDLAAVPPSLIATHGAVSEEVAVAMAEGIRSRAAVDVGVGVTGIAGPGGGSADKPVGTVAIAVAASGSNTRSRVFRFTGEREQIKFQASQAALDMVRRMLISR